MIAAASVLGYIGIGGLIAAWLEHRNDDLHPFERVNPLLCGALWLPFWVAGVVLLAYHHIEASGAAKRRR